MNSKPWRAQGGLGLLSHTISVQKSQESIPLILERRDGAERHGGDARRGDGVLLRSGKRERGREGVRGFLTPTTLTPKD